MLKKELRYFKLICHILRKIEFIRDYQTISERDLAMHRLTEHSAPAPTFIEGVAKLFSFL